MENLQINTGVKRIMINDDPGKFIEFNPEDVLFAERFYALIKVFEEQEVKFQARLKQISENEAKDEYGIPLNTQETFDLAIEICNFLREQLDKVFGAGTSATVFGETQSLGMFEQFFAGIAPFIQNSRVSKVTKYQMKKSGK